MFAEPPGADIAEVAKGNGSLQCPGVATGPPRQRSLN